MERPETRNVEWTLNTFDLASDSLELVTIEEDETWSALPQLAAQFDGMLVAGVFAPITQLERTFSIAQQRLKLPTLCLQPERGGLLCTLAKELPLGAIVSLWQDRESLREILDRSDLAQVHKRYVLAPDQRPQTGLPNSSFEVHSIPGKVAMWQCAALAGSATFHPAAGASIPEAHSREEKTCSCGNSVHITLQ